MKTETTSKTPRSGSVNRAKALATYVIEERIRLFGIPEILKSIALGLGSKTVKALKLLKRLQPPGKYAADPGRSLSIPRILTLIFGFFFIIP